MPINVLRVKSKEELQASVRRLSASGYSCRPEDELSVVCTKAINEITYHTVIVITEP